MPKKKAAAKKAAKPAQKRSKTMSNEAEQEYEQGQQEIPTGAQQAVSVAPQADGEPPTPEELQAEIDTIWATLDQHGIRPQPPATAGAAPPSTAPEPESWGVLALPMDTTTPTVSLEQPPESVAVGTILQIDLEFMTVTDADDVNELVVQRGTPMSAIAAHPAESTVAIGVVVG